MKTNRILIIALMVIIAVLTLQILINRDSTDEIVEIGRESLDGLDPASYTSAYTILDISEKEIELAPYNYDGDARESFEDDIRVYELGGNVSYYKGEAMTEIYGDDKTHKTVTYSGSSYEKLKADIELNGWEWAYIWMENDKVKKIMVYGEIIIYK